MGSHIWFEQCPHCDFEEMIVCTDGYLNLEMSCPICGYIRWTQEKAPKVQDIEIARKKTAEMDAEEKQKAIDMYYEDNFPLVRRLR